MEAGEGFAGATGHNQLPAVRRLESFQDGGNGPVLMRPGCFRLPTLESGRIPPGECTPVNRTAVQVVQGEGMDMGPLVFERFLGMLAQFRRGDNEALCKRPFARSGEKGIQVFFCHPVIPEFALDGPQILGIGLFGHQVNARIRAMLAPGPIWPQPDPGKFLAVEGIGLEEGLNQSLKLGALVPGRERCPAIVL